jgi:hypothetical protein
VTRTLNIDILPQIGTQREGSISPGTFDGFAFEQSRMLVALPTVSAACRTTLEVELRNSGKLQ